MRTVWTIRALATRALASATVSQDSKRTKSCVRLVLATPCAMRQGEPLDYFLTRRGVGTWAEVHHAIQSLQVSVNGQVCKHYRRALVASDVVVVAGETMVDDIDCGTLICYKRSGLACSHVPEHAPLIYDEVPIHYQHPNLQTVGRLDRDTTGLLLLTIDGLWAQRVLAPKKRCWKRYRIAFSGTLATDAEARVASGMMIMDDLTPCLPGRLELSHHTNDGLQNATMHLCEGRHHQVKRMIAMLGGEVRRLHRDRIGGLSLPMDLQIGEMRPLRAEESAALFQQPD
jgi:16S rRNA pseudouridine516 synthase